MSQHVVVFYVHFPSSVLIVCYLQGFLSAAPEIVNHSLAHEHVHNHHHTGHHHGIDMDHPALALSMTVISITIKEGYTCYFNLFTYFPSFFFFFCSSIIVKSILSSLGISLWKF